MRSEGLKRMNLTATIRRLHQLRNVIILFKQKLKILRNKIDNNHTIQSYWIKQILELFMALVWFISSKILDCISTNHSALIRQHSSFCLSAST